MRSLVVVATNANQSVNSLTKARNIKDFLEQTGEFESVAIYELEKAEGPLQQWSELQDSST
jgi:hypothetical protein